MKLLHISEHYAPVGGAETYMLAVLDALEDRGHKNSVIYRQEHARTVHRDGCQAFYVPEDSDSYQQIRQIVLEHDPDVIYLHLIYDPEVIRIAAALRPTVAYVHNFHPVCPGLGKYFRRVGRICQQSFNRAGCTLNIYLRRCASARHPLSVWRVLQSTAQQQAAYHQVQHVLVASSYMKKVLGQNGFAPERVHVLPYFVDLPSEPASVVPQESVPVVLYVGRVEWEKGVPYLIRAVSRIQIPFRLIVAGDGTRLGECRALADRLGLADKIEFTGWLPRSELVALYRRACLLAFPSIWPEPFGLTGPEAMACGTPVVAFAVGGVTDWLEDGKNGFLVRPQDVEQLAHKIGTLLRDHELARKMGEYGRRRVLEEYAIDRHLEGLIKILRQAGESDS